MKRLTHETSRPIIARFVREQFEPSDTGFDGDGGYFRDAFRSVFDMSEPEGASSERPDKLIVSKSTGLSFVGEFKASESDFIADQKKSFRFRAEQGMGDYRMYFCEEGIIEGFQVEKYAPGWGLGIIHGDRITVPVEPQKFHRKAWWEEIKCLAVAGGNLSIECKKSADEAKPIGAGRPSGSFAALAKQLIGDGHDAKTAMLKHGDELAKLAGNPRKARNFFKQLAANAV